MNEQEENRMPFYKILAGGGLITLLFVIAVFGIVFLFNYEKNKAYSAKLPTGLYNNKLVVNMFKNDKGNLIYNFYDGYTKNREVSIFIINNALANDIPIHYFFGMAYIESRYHVAAISNRNLNGSKDYGLFQLNSRVYKKYNKKYLLNPKYNSKLAGLHLTRNFERYGNWYKAIRYYNGSGDKAEDYLYNVLEYAEKLDNDFYRYIDGLEEKE